MEDDDIEITDLDATFSDDKKPRVGLQQQVVMWQRALNRRRFRWLTALSILVLVVLVMFANLQGELAVLGMVRGNVTSFLYHVLPHSEPPAPLVVKPAVVILPAKDGFSCVTDTTWSPDSRYVVILGYEQTCAVGGEAAPGLLTIHDVVSGKRVRSYLLNDYVLSTFHRQYPGMRTEGVFSYHLVLWSHDRFHVAVLFSAAFYHEAQAPSFDGLLLLNLKGGTASVLLHMDRDNYMSYLIWDTRVGTEYVEPSNFSITAENPGYSVKPALYYRWGNGGGADELLPAQDVSGRSPTFLSGPTGDPNGGNTFTPWQPGELGLTTSMGNGTYLPGVGDWSTYFAAWSPNGRYVVDNLVIDGRLNVPGHPAPDRKTLITLSMEMIPLLPVRDKGLARLLQELAARPQRPGSIYTDESVAWRFDGKELAAYGTGDIFDTTVNIYRSTDGVQVATLLPSVAGVGQLGGRGTLRWSNNGSRVLLFSVGLGTITIWNVPPAL